MSFPHPSAFTPYHITLYLTFYIYTPIATPLYQASLFTPSALYVAYNIHPTPDHSIPGFYVNFPHQLYTHATLTARYRRGLYPPSAPAPPPPPPNSQPSTSRHECPSCSFVTASNVRLAKHTLIHSNPERSYSCMACKTSFADPLERDDHMRLILW